MNCETCFEKVHVIIATESKASQPDYLLVTFTSAFDTCARYWGLREIEPDSVLNVELNTTYVMYRTVYTFPNLMLYHHIHLSVALFYVALL